MRGDAIFYGGIGFLLFYFFYSVGLKEFAIIPSILITAFVYKYSKGF